MEILAALFISPIQTYSQDSSLVRIPFVGVVEELHLLSYDIDASSANSVRWRCGVRQSADECNTTVALRLHPPE